MPRKKRLERNLDSRLKTRKFYKKKFFVFVLDLQLFYETGAALKVVMPSSDIRYIFLATPLEALNFHRSVGIGSIDGDTFSWIDFYPNSSLSLCISWLVKFTRCIKVSLFLFCFLLYIESKKKLQSKIFFGLFVYYLIYAFDLSGWSLCIHKPLAILGKKNRHFLIVLMNTINDLPQVNIFELEKVLEVKKVDLTGRREGILGNLKKLTNEDIFYMYKIKIFYWILQQAALKKVYNSFSLKTWASCMDILLYYAQSRRLWIP